MNTKSLSRFAAVMLLACVVSAPAVLAQTPENAMFEVTEPTTVGDVVLQPGQYMIRVVSGLANRNRVQITDVNKTTVYTTVLTVPHALEPNETVPETRLVFYPAFSGQPRALRTWFPQGAPREEGHDIVYDEERAKLFARASSAPVVTYRGTLAETDTTAPDLLIVTPDARIEPYVAPRVTMTRVEEKPVQTARAELPRTAGNGASIALLGALAIAGAVAFRAFNR